MNIQGLFSKSSRADASLHVSVADKPHLHQRGLMFRKHLKDDEGMYFIFGREQKLSFWGENTFIPLDIAFVDNQGIIKKIDRISPMSRKAVSSDVPCRYAIEANLGYFSTNGVRVGDKVFLHKDTQKGNYLSFTTKKRNSSYINETSKDRFKEAQFLNADEDADLNNQIQDNDNDLSLDDEQLPLLDFTDLGQYLEDDLQNIDQQELQQQEIGDQDQGYGDLGEIEKDITEEPKLEPEFEYPRFSNVFEAIKWAENNNEAMRITYRTDLGNGVTRDIEPHGTFHAKTTNRQILVSFDETIGGIRAFIIKNIQGFSFIGKRFNKKFRIK